MPEPHSHMQADGVNHVIETELRRSDLTKELQDEYLRAIVTEKTSYETQLKQLKADDSADNSERIKLIAEALSATTAELERISGKTESRKTPGVRK